MNLDPNPTTAQVLEYNMRLIKYTLMQAHADGRPLVELFGNDQWVANVCARFAIYEGGDVKEKIVGVIDGD